MAAKVINIAAGLEGNVYTISDHYVHWHIAAIGAFRIAIWHMLAGCAGAAGVVVAAAVADWCLYAAVLSY